MIDVDVNMRMNKEGKAKEMKCGTKAKKKAEHAKESKMKVKWLRRWGTNENRLAHIY
jgi:hypothetical protein